MKKTLSILGGVAAAFLLAWVIRDIFLGEWQTIPAKVIGRNYVPDRSYWMPVTTSCGQNCTTTTLQYFPVPEEFNVSVRERDGGWGSYNDAWAYHNLSDGEYCTVIVRVGRSGLRWFGKIEHAKGREW